MTTETRVGAFVIASVLVLGSATYFVHTTQTVRGQVAYNTHLRYAGGWPRSGRALRWHQGGASDRCAPWSEDPTRIEILCSR